MGVDVLKTTERPCGKQPPNLKEGRVVLEQMTYRRNSARFPCDALDVPTPLGCESKRLLDQHILTSRKSSDSQLFM
jgi:hypothetical protein